VFKLAPNPDGSWAETVLYGFGSQGGDGYWPRAGVILDAAGNLYGTTLLGGAHDKGTVFKLTSNPDGSWMEQVIRSFGGRPAATPYAGLIFDAAGNLYGTTGVNPWDANSSKGSVFKLTPNPDGSWTKSTLHAFKGTDGADPWGSLVLDAAGNLYGTTRMGGAYDSGTVFKLTPEPDGRWKLTRLHVFKNDDQPYAGLVMDAAGNLYGTTRNGGKGWGVVFRITP
jgi:uncharacterized repeat protein (TIGR03803 family)